MSAKTNPIATGEARTLLKDGVIYLVFPNGECYRYESYLRNRQYWLDADERKLEQTDKRVQWRALVKPLDETRVDCADYRAVQRMIDFLDAPYHMAAKRQRIRWATSTICSALHLIDPSDVREVRQILWLVMQYRHGAKKLVMERFHMRENTYRARIIRYTQIIEKAAERQGLKKKLKIFFA